MVWFFSLENLHIFFEFKWYVIEENLTKTYLEFDFDALDFHFNSIQQREPQISQFPSLSSTFLKTSICWLSINCWCSSNKAGNSISFSCTVDKVQGSALLFHRRASQCSALCCALFTVFNFIGWNGTMRTSAIFRVTFSANWLTSC